MRARSPWPAVRRRQQCTDRGGAGQLRKDRAQPPLAPLREDRRTQPDCGHCLRPAPRPDVLTGTFVPSAGIDRDKFHLSPFSASGKDMHSATTSGRSEEHTSELQSLMRISYAVFCLKKQKTRQNWSFIQHKEK